MSTESILGERGREKTVDFSTFVMQPTYNHTEQGWVAAIHTSFRLNAVLYHFLFYCLFLRVKIHPEWP